MMGSVTNKRQDHKGVMTIKVTQNDMGMGNNVCADGISETFTLPRPPWACFDIATVF